MTQPVTTEPTGWQIGQQAIIDRNRIVSIARITRGGRAVVEGRIFDFDGTERGGNANPWRRSKLELLTPEIQAETELVCRGRAASHTASAAVHAADRWLGKALSAWRPGEVPNSDDVAKAERLAVAILQVIGEPP